MLVNSLHCRFLLLLERQVLGKLHRFLSTFMRLGTLSEERYRLLLLFLPYILAINVLILFILTWSSGRFLINILQFYDLLEINLTNTGILIDFVAVLSQTCGSADRLLLGFLHCKSLEIYLYAYPFRKSFTYSYVVFLYLWGLSMYVIVMILDLLGYVFEFHSISSAVISQYEIAWSLLMG